MVGRATFAACSWILEQADARIRRVLPRVEPRHRQEGLAGQHHAHARQARDRRGDDPARRAGRSTCASSPRARTTTAQRRQRRRLPVGRQQQRRALAQRHHRDVHRHRPGRRQRRRVVGRHRLHRADAGRRPLHLDHHPVADRRHPRRRHRACRPSASASRCWAATARARSSKLAEIVAGVVLAGEISLGAAISSLDWVSSHEKYGRNR